MSRSRIWLPRVGVDMSWNKLRSMRSECRSFLSSLSEWIESHVVHLSLRSPSRVREVGFVCKACSRLDLRSDMKCWAV